MTVDDKHSIPLTPQELQAIAERIPTSLWGEHDFTRAEVTWLQEAPATMRALIDHLRWAESELDFYVNYCGKLNGRIREAARLAADTRPPTAPGQYGPALKAIEDTLCPRDTQITPGHEHIRAHVPVGRGRFVQEPDGLRRTLLTRLTDGRVMCALCFAYVTRAALHEDHGVLTDVCEACSLLEQDVYARDGWDPQEAQQVVAHVLADRKFLDYLRELGPGASHVIVALQAWTDKDHERDDDGYQALADARDEDDVAFESAMRARRGHGDE